MPFQVIGMEPGIVFQPLKKSLPTLGGV
jgi:hypothetical protein